MSRGAPIQEKPNILLVMLDDVWPYHWRQHKRRSPYTGINPGNVAYNPSGSNLYVHAPWLDKLSSRGVVFDNAYAQPVCGADRASLLTGQYTHRHGIGSIPTLGTVPASLNDTPAYSFPLLTQRLKVEGYTCGAIGKYHLHRYDPAENLAAQFRHAHSVAGFDWTAITYHNLAPRPRPRGPGGENWRGDNYNYYRYKTGVLDIVQSPGDLPGDHRAADYSAQVQANDAIEFIKAQGRDPWFCYLAFNAPHNPFDRVVDPALYSTKEYFNEALPAGTAWANYQQQLESIDKLMQGLEDATPARIWANTTVVFTADNGSLSQVLASAARSVSRGGHGKDLGPTVTALLADPVARLKNSPFEGGLRVPLVIGGAGVGAGRVSNALFHTTDLYPTLLKLAGGPTVGDIDGIDQGPVLRGEQAEVRRELLSMRFSPNGNHATASDYRDVGFSKRLEGFPTNGRYKLIEKLGETNQLYRLEGQNGNPIDPWELDENLWDNPAYSSEQADMVSSLASALA